MSPVQSTLPGFAEPVARVRRSDPRSSKTAAAMDREGRSRQWKLILLRLLDGPASADTAARVIGKHRSVASSRLGVLQARGQVEKAGMFDEPDDEGHVRSVLRYRLTAQGQEDAEWLRGAL